MSQITREFLVGIGWSGESAGIILDHKTDRGTVMMLNRIARKYGLEKFDVPRPPWQRQKKKQRIPNRIRWDVWERDNFTCKHCGKRRYLSVDHIVPEIKGGSLDLKNLQTLCRSCNSKKGAKTK